MKIERIKKSEDEEMNEMGAPGVCQCGTPLDAKGRCPFCGLSEQAPQEQKEQKEKKEPYDMEKHRRELLERGKPEEMRAFQAETETEHKPEKEEILIKEYEAKKHEAPAELKPFIKSIENVMETNLPFGTNGSPFLKFPDKMTEAAFWETFKKEVAVMPIDKFITLRKHTAQYFKYPQLTEKLLTRYWREVYQRGRI
jgi:hypothetical protein